MPKSSEHRNKYEENKYIIDTVLDEHDKRQCNWMSTVCFYAALHIVEMQLALDGVHSKNHIERETNMMDSKRITPYILMRYKQMYTNSILARYEAQSIAPTIAHQMKTYLAQIENKLNIST